MGGWRGGRGSSNAAAAAAAAAIAASRFCYRIITAQLAVMLTAQLIFS